MSRARDFADLAGAADAGGLTGRNLIINGAAAIDQRNGGSSVTPASSAYTLDRWLANVTAASKFSVQQSTVAPDNFTNSVLITSTSAYTPVSGDYISFQTRIEANNIAHVGWGSSAAKNVTLSFWARSSLTGTFGGSFYFPASTARTHPFSYTINSADTWEYKTVTIAGDTATNTAPTGNSLYVIVQWALGAGSTYQTGTSGWQNGNYVAPSGVVDLVATSGATFYITGVQLEVGEQATPFDHSESYGETLARCQRYYFTVQAPIAANGRYYSGAHQNQFTVHRNFAVQMRTSPTTVASFTNLDNTATVTLNNSKSGGVCLAGTFTNSSFMYGVFTDTSTYDAEL